MDLLTGGAILTVLVIGVGFAFWLGRRTASSGDHPGSDGGRRLDEYQSYPFDVNAAGHVVFNPAAFSKAVDVLLRERNERAARELIIIGEQNLVRETFASEDLEAYKRLYAAYDGEAVILDNDRFLENYGRLVHQFGRSFPNTGIEILLHNLVNPSRSLVAIENGEVTGRAPGSGATNLVLDLKTRRQMGQDKVNYELNIGARQFKCTTVPIFRADHGLVGAVCINIDTRFLREHVMHDPDRLEAFVDNLLRTDFELEENILSPDEYASALKGKRHFLDEAIRSSGSPSQERRLAAIMFSDIVGFTTLMGEDEAATMRIVAENERIHREAFLRHGGRMLKELGDGILASFDSASAAVGAAQDIRSAVDLDGRFRIRIGIHLGEVVQTGGDVHGDGVNIASRIQAAMEPGAIGVSGVVYDNIRNKEGIAASPLGPRDLKNVSTPIELWTIDAPE